MTTDKRVIIRGGGEMGSGVAWRLTQCGFDILITEIERPTAIRRWVCFAEAVYDGDHRIESVSATRVTSMVECHAVWERGQVAVMVCPDAHQLRDLAPDVIVDAILAKRNTGVKIDMAGRVIGLGPGFDAGNDVHAVIETNRGANLGRCIWNGPAERNTSTPGLLGGETTKRVMRTPTQGTFQPDLSIGEMVEPGDVVAHVGDTAIKSRLNGIVRGLMRGGLPVTPGMKVGDIDPRGDIAICGRISDKALAIAGGVLEAILSEVPYT